jgi:hypothetical protein
LPVVMSVSCGAEKSHAGVTVAFGPITSGIYSGFSR